MAVPYTFATATSSIPLSQLDSNFATGITLGNTTVYLGNTTTSIGNLTLTNATISSVASTFPNSYLANSSVTIGSTSLSLGGTATTITGLTLTGSTFSGTSVTDSGLTSGRVTYATTGGLLTDSSSLTYNGVLTLGTSTSQNSVFNQVIGSGGANQGLVIVSSTTGKGWLGFNNSNSAGIPGQFTYDFNTSTMNLFSSGAITFNTNAGSEIARFSTAGNLGIGTSSPSNTFVVSNGGAAGFEVNPAGTNPSLNSYNRSTSSWINLTYAANQHIFNYAGTAEGMRLNASGYLGIGTSSPVSLLHVYSSTTNNARLTIQGTGTTAGNYRGINLYGASGFSGGIFQDESTNDLSFWNNGGALMTLTQTGNLGLGVTPSAWVSGDTIFQIKSGTSYASLWGRSGSLRSIANAYYDGTNYKYASSSYAPAIFQVENTGSFSWNTAPTGTAGNNVTFTQAMTLDNSGNLGVGITSPGARLDASIDNPTRGIVQRARNNASSSQTGVQFQFTQNAIADWVIGQPAGVDAFAFWNGRNPSADGSERMRIDSSGNLLVGKTALNAAVVGFQVAPSGQVNSTLAGSTSATLSYALYSTGASAYRFYVGMDGTINATSIVITAISDERLKENIRDLDTGLSTVMALKPRRFDWKEGKGQDKKNAAGFIAQEFQEVLPNSISTFKAGEDGIDYLTMNHEELIPTLVKAIQEQQAIIEQLKAKVGI